jgi:hypothetical protein
MIRTPPRQAHRVLRMALDDAAFDVIAGDLDEEVARGWSARWYGSQALRSAAAHGFGRCLTGLAAFGACAFAASVVPARRTAVADPAEALKGE